MSQPETSIAIIGAGPLGLSVALALHRRGHHPVVYDAGQATGHDDDGRILALSHGSRDLLDLLGAWPGANATEIRQINVSQLHGTSEIRIRAEECHVPALGYVVAARHLVRRLQTQAVQLNIPIRYDSRLDDVIADRDRACFSITQGQGSPMTDHAQLVVCCEGAIPDEAATTRRNYDQHALLCVAHPKKPHTHLAHERFTPDGPLALLPHGTAYAVVWTVPAAHAAVMHHAPNAEWLAALNTVLPATLQLAAIEARTAYPLGLRMRREVTGDRCVWLGNAAQTLHPVAGQGFNLALRDAWELAEILTGASDPGAPPRLRAYSRQRRLDRSATVGFTDTLVRGFSNSHPLLSPLRGMGLAALEALPPLRRFVARRMIFGARAWP